MTVPADVAVDDVQPGAAVQLSVLEPFARVELAMRPAGVVEDLGKRPHHVLVIVEDLVVVPGHAEVAFHEDGVGCVHHDLPDVVVGQEGLERAVAGQVPQHPVDDDLRARQVVGAQPPLVLRTPLGDLSLHEQAQPRSVGVGAQIEGEVLGQRLHPALDLDERG